MQARHASAMRYLFAMFLTSLVFLTKLTGAQVTKSEEGSADQAQRIARVENGIPAIPLGEANRHCR